MPGVQSRDFSSPDETRTPSRTRVEIVGLPVGQIGRYTFEPGWRWSECIKPVVNTDMCKVEHVGYVISGTLGIRHKDGTELIIPAGSVYHIAPDHDGWTVGNEAAVVVEFQGATNYAKS
jgi:hypothetical protein